MDRDEAVRLVQEVANDRSRLASDRIAAARHMLTLQLVSGAVDVLRNMAEDDQMKGGDRLDAAYALWQEGRPDDAEASYASIRDSRNINQRELQCAEESVRSIGSGKEPALTPHDGVLPAPIGPPPTPL